VQRLAAGAAEGIGREYPHADHERHGS
jgi:hypothetical protein